MEIPSEVPVMILPNAILFPQAMLPLHIFEPRYRRMLVDALHSHRMFCVAMQKPGCVRETPVPVAGLGLIRAPVANRNGTSHLILQGVARVELVETVRYKPYRVQRIRPLRTIAGDAGVVETLMAQVRELVEDRLQREPARSHSLPQSPSPGGVADLAALAAQARARFLEHLHGLTDPEQVVDLVTGALLPNPLERQLILETVDAVDRLKHLLHFLVAEIQRPRKE
ncbi:MAG: LON peptidase substrate-binding domain-containing protein [Pedosphaera parvula]|nr:LON peptidase substrate-binding domain-containing protein [Pedosphaera parvula]